MRDDLELLDDDLAAGRIDASTYRRRRDGLLAGGPAGPVPVPPGLPDVPPAAPAPPAAVRDPDPFPPPFRWDAGAAPRRQPSPPVPAHVTVPPWGRGVLRPTPGPAPGPTQGPAPGPTSGRTRGRMQGPEVFAPGGPGPLAVLGTVLVVALALAVLVASFLL